MSHISVFVADDNESMREVLAFELGRHFTVHRSLANGKQLVDAAVAGSPDVIVTDVWMPGLSGVEAMLRLKQLGCRTPFVLVSADASIGRDCLEAGATAFVCKVDIERDLADAVIAAIEGRIHVSETARAACGLFNPPGKPA